MNSPCVPSVYWKAYEAFTPITAAVCKLSGLKDGWMRLQTVHFPFNAATRFDEVLSHASVKKKTQRFKGFKFRTFNGRFQVTSRH